MSDQTVFLVMDVQNGAIERVQNGEAYLERLAPVVQATREAGVKIVYIRTGFRPGYPEHHPHNTSTTKAFQWKAFVEDESSSQIHTAVAPASRDVVVIKHRVSAFTSTDLDLILRAYGAQKLVLTGISTSGVVLSTVRQAADLDFRITVLEDLCVDPIRENHEFLMKKIISRQAEVTSSAEWLAGLKTISA
jgi:nicotinamidase-related amidase